MLCLPDKSSFLSTWNEPIVVSQPAASRESKVIGEWKEIELNTAINAFS
jgi:hypothetical protein